MKKWLARVGAVGGTARWAAKIYHVATEGGNDIDIYLLYRMMIKFRYAAIPNPGHEAFLLGHADQIRGLRGLVVAILSLEAGFMDNTPEHQEMFWEIVDEELLKAGVPENIVYG